MVSVFKRSAKKDALYLEFDICDAISLEKRSSLKSRDGKSEWINMPIINLPHTAEAPADELR